MATKTASSAVRSLIKAYRLHDDAPPVRLAALEEAFPVVLRDLSETGLRGFFVISDETDPVIVIDENLSEEWQRVYYAHEIGHILMGHPGNLRARDVDNWFESRQEREAWAVAAELLIPPRSTLSMDEISASAVAARCSVPAELVELLPKDW